MQMGVRAVPAFTVKPVPAAEWNIDRKRIGGDLLLDGSRHVVESFDNVNVNAFRAGPQRDIDRPGAGCIGNYLGLALRHMDGYKAEAMRSHVSRFVILAVDGEAEQRRSRFARDSVGDVQDEARTPLAITCQAARRLTQE